MKKPSDAASKILPLLNYLYGKSITGAVGIESAEHLARQYMRSPDLSRNIDQLIRRQSLKTASISFVIGLGGLLSLPVTLPANLSAVLFIQLRMIAAIAYMCGYDLKNDNVQTMIYAALCGNALSDILKKGGIKLGTKLGHNLASPYLHNIVTHKLSHELGLRLFEHSGKFIPIVGGLISGTVEAGTTHLIGRVSKKIFYTPPATAAAEPITTPAVPTPAPQ